VGVAEWRLMSVHQRQHQKHCGYCVNRSKICDILIYIVGRSAACFDGASPQFQ